MNLRRVLQMFLGATRPPITADVPAHNGSSTLATTIYVSKAVNTSRGGLLVALISTRDTAAITTPTVTWNSLTFTNRIWAANGTTNYGGIFTLVVPAGTNFTGNVLCTFAASVNRQGLIVYFVENAGNYIDTNSSTANPGSINPLVTLPGAMVLALCVSGTAASTITWSIGTNDVDELCGSVGALYHSSMHVSVTGTSVSFTATRSGAVSGGITVAISLGY